MVTASTKASSIHREWHMIDLKGQILGRVSTEIAKLLMGKSKPYFVRNLDCGDYVVAINAKEIKVSGKKAQNKVYFSHSGYPEGFKKETFSQFSSRKPEEVIYHAVRGMLPQNKLRDRMLKRLHVYPHENHPHQEKLKA